MNLDPVHNFWSADRLLKMWSYRPGRRTVSWSGARCIVPRRAIAALILATFSPAALPQQPKPVTTQTPVQIDNALSTSKPDDVQIPEAYPARPTVTNPAHIPPVGYLQFEQGFLLATASPGGVAHQVFAVQTTKLAVHPRLMFQFLSQPFANTRLLPAPGLPNDTNDAGDLLLGAQTLLTVHSGLVPTIALGYNRRLRSGSAPDLDIGSYAQSANLIISGDLGSFHYDSNFGAAEQQDTSVAPTLRRAQYNQSLSVTHDLLPHLGGHDLTLTGELWHFTQPLVTTTHSGLPSTRSNAVGFVAAFGYGLRPNLVFDAGLDHGLTSTSSDWQGFAGFTYLLPHRLWPRSYGTHKH